MTMTINNRIAKHFFAQQASGQDTAPIVAVLHLCNGCKSFLLEPIGNSLRIRPVIAYQCLNVACLDNFVIMDQQLLTEKQLQEFQARNRQERK
jgi:hypothetical protein